MKPSLELTQAQYLEVEKLSLGVFHPVREFMSDRDFHSVVDDFRLISGEFFPLPIFLDVRKADAEAFTGKAEVELRFDGKPVATLRPSRFYTVDKRKVAEKIYTVNDPKHPGVKNLLATEEVFVAGSVELHSRAHFDFSKFEMTPAETRALFAERGWKTIVGFQTRNVPHRAHEYLQRVALETVDGLFIQPLVGRKKAGDYTPEAILKGYQTLVEGFFPKTQVALGILSTYMRYAGPREALFHAIIRRNYGCTHFIVGRDHAGVGDYYPKYGAHAMIRRFRDRLGITVMTLHGPYYCEICDGVVTEHTCPHLETKAEVTHQISGTMIRGLLVEGKKPDRRFFRPEIVEALKGTKIFIEEQDEG